MPVGFQATECHVTCEDDVLVIIFSAPSTEDEDFYLMLQLGLAPDEQDVKLGMDQPYIEYCGQGWSWYGQILSFRLGRDRVRVQMDSEAAAEMNNDGQIEVIFSLADGEFNTIREGLRTTFAGCAYYTDEA